MISCHKVVFVQTCLLFGLSLGTFTPPSKCKEYFSSTKRYSLVRSTKGTCAHLTSVRDDANVVGDRPLRHGEDFANGFRHAVAVPEKIQSFRCDQCDQIGRFIGLWANF